jgi:hypothetical protein
LQEKVLADSRAWVGIKINSPERQADGPGISPFTWPLQKGLDLLLFGHGQVKTRNKRHARTAEQSVPMIFSAKDTDPVEHAVLCGFPTA